MIKINNDGKTERYVTLNQLSGEEEEMAKTIFEKAKTIKLDVKDQTQGKPLSDKAKEFAFSESVPDAINHPLHYNNGEYECIDVMISQYGTQAVKAFCLLNAFKYIWRCEEKHIRPIGDINKAIWYLQKYVELSKYDD